MTSRLQLHGLYVLCGLAAAILVLMGYTLSQMAETAAADGGKVQGIDSGVMTGLSLMFREVLGRIQSIWDHLERGEMQRDLAQSAPAERPAGTPEDPVNVKETKT